MESSDLIQFNIEVSESDAAVEDIDEMTRQLLSELRETNVESVELTKGGIAPKGSKGDPMTIGSIAIAVLPAFLPNVVSLVQDWVERGQGRTVKFKGMGIEFEGSPEEFQKVLASLEVEGQAKGKGKSARAPKIFISYRRADSADVTGRIYDRLIEHFGKSAIFKDVDSIPPGVDFKEHLEKAVGKCRIFLVVIGDRWLEGADSKRRNRLQDPDDFVRIEIESALNRNILIIPLLVRGALMPAEEKLPRSLQKLVYRNGISIRSDPDFHGDIDRLIEAITNYSNKKS
ncbi:MAG TPA: toll/interleukin-1 receptor domain-containing protein [Anaerolineales bacterium]|nr:toll/interleukin-1 receptor domain-containing protein [Anaerolineales bacterium]